MNKSYIIVPVILLALFGFLYNGALKEMTAKETALAEGIFSSPPTLNSKLRTWMS